MPRNRALPLSVQQRLRGVRPRVNPSSASLYGQSLASQNQALQTFNEFVNSLVSPGTTSPAFTDPHDSYYQRDRYSESGDPRMGYGDDYTWVDYMADVDAGRAPGFGAADQMADIYLENDGDPSTNPTYPNLDSSLYPEGAYSPGVGTKTNEKPGVGELSPKEEDAAERDAAVESMINDAISDLMSDIARMEAERDKALRDARNDIAAEYQKQINKVTEQVGELEGKLDAWKASAAETQRLTQEAYARAQSTARGTYEVGAPLLDESGQQAKADITAGYDDAIAELQDQLTTIGADPMTAQTLNANVNELRELALSTSEEDTETQKKILQAAENVALTAAQEAGATNAADLARIEESFSEQLTEAIEGLMTRKGELADARDEAIKKATEAIYASYEGLGSFEGQLDYAYALTDEAMDDYFRSIGYDEIQRNQIENTFGSLIENGIRGRADIQKYYNDYLAASENGEAPFSEETLEALLTMSDVFEGAMDAWEQSGVGGSYGQAGDGRLVDKGDRVTWTRGVGEAPNNIANRNHPAYQERAQFMSEMHDYILQNFNVSSAGQYRDTSVSGGGQRSSNSDHYSGGAVDFSGSQAELERLFGWLQTQPWVSFANLYTSGGAAGTLHVSGILGGNHSVDDGHDHGGTTASSGGDSSGGGGGLYAI